MSEEEKAEIRLAISKEIDELKKSIEELEELTKPIAPDVSLGRLTRMEAINEKSINESSLRNARDKLVKLEFTLSRMEQPDFGLCSLCKQPIPKVRVLRVPESTRCVNCVGK